MRRTTSARQAIPSTGDTAVRVRGGRRLAGGAPDGEAFDGLRRLNLPAYRRVFRTQGLAFKLACAYFFFEYYRPQDIVTEISILPWSSLTLWGGLAALAAEGGPKADVKSPLHWLLALFSVVLLASMVNAVFPEASTSRWDIFWLWLPVYALVIGTVTTLPRMMVFLALWAVWNAKMAISGVKQWAGNGFGFSSWGVLGAPGWFSNSGEFAIEMVIFCSVMLFVCGALWPVLSKWKRIALASLPLCATFSVVASSSRGGMGALAVALLLLALKSRYKFRAAIGVAVLGALIFLATPPEFKARFETTGTDTTSRVRAVYRKRGVEIMNEHPVLGVGYANWRPYYRSHYGEWAHEPHNIFIQAGAELGYTGLASFVLLIVGTLGVNWRTRSLTSQLPEHLRDRALLLSNLANGLDCALVGYLVAGYFVTVLYYPFFWVNLAMTAMVAQVTRRELRLASAAAPAEVPGGSGGGAGPGGSRTGRMARPVVGELVLMPVLRGPSAPPMP